MEMNEYTITTLSEFIRKIIEKKGIKKWDVFIEDKTIYGAYFYNSIFKSVLNREFNTRTHNLTFIIRIFDDRDSEKMGVGSVILNIPRRNLIEYAIEKAKIIAKHTEEFRYDLIDPKMPGLHYHNPKTFDKKVWDDPEEFIEQKAQYLEERLQENPGVVATFGKFRTYRVKKMLINSNGFNKIKKSTYFCYEFSFKAEKDGKKAEYWPKGFIKSVNQLKFDDYISEWAARTRDILEMKKMNTLDPVDVILPAPILRKMLLNTIGYTATGKALYEKATPFKIGQQVAAPEFNLYDDGLMEGGINTSSWDSEGFPKRRTPVIENGIFKNFLFDQRYAVRLGTQSTGNAQRDIGKNGLMNIEFNNISISPGTTPLRQIVEDSRHTIQIIDISNLRTDFLTGKFAAWISHAYLIKNGELGDPVRGGYLIGNIYKMIKNISDISAETRMVMNAKIPYIKFSNLSILT